MYCYHISSLGALPVPCILWIFDITWKGRDPQALQRAFLTSIKFMLLCQVLRWAVYVIRLNITCVLLDVVKKKLSCFPSGRLGTRRGNIWISHFNLARRYWDLDHYLSPVVKVSDCWCLQILRKNDFRNVRRDLRKFNFCCLQYFWLCKSWIKLISEEEKDNVICGNGRYPKPSKQM